MHLFLSDTTQGPYATLPPEESKHCVRVLRMQLGDELYVTSGDGTMCRARVANPDPTACQVEIIERLPDYGARPFKLHMAVAPTKNNARMEWFVEKAVEVGVDEISFLNCQFSERRIVKLPRLDKIVIAATKQSHKAWKTVLKDITPFKDFIDQPREGGKYIAHCYEEIPRTSLFDHLRQTNAPQDATVLIGPEGDFSIDEVRYAVANGYQSVHLGPSRLRTETAGLSAVMMMQLSKM